jgi:hypothetical protein
MKISLALPREQRGLLAWCALLCTLITVLTVQGIPETAAASLRGDDPWTIEPGWRVADVLLVPTFQVRHPILSLILMKTDNLALHGDLTGRLAA